MENQARPDTRQYDNIHRVQWHTWKPDKRKLENPSVLQYVA